MNFHGFISWSVARIHGNEVANSLVFYPVLTRVRILSNDDEKYAKK